MNAERRKALAALIDNDDDVFAGSTSKLKGLAEEVKTVLEGLRDEEQEAYDNMPESFQNGEKGEKAQAAITAMEEAISSLEEIDNTLDDIETAINTAAE
jgi:seryl-tRNA synthetase